MSSDISILYVDDQQSELEWVRVAVQRSGLPCRLHTSTCAYEALTLLHYEKLRPDLVLTDLNMPGLDGLGFVQALCCDPVLESVPVGVLSGAMRDGDAPRLKELGVSLVIPKPLRADAVVPLLGRASVMSLHASA